LTPADRAASIVAPPAKSAKSASLKSHLTTSSKTDVHLEAFSKIIVIQGEDSRRKRVTNETFVACMRIYCTSRH
jgi:hypothetical protein